MVVECIADIQPARMAEQTSFEHHSERHKLGQRGQIPCAFAALIFQMAMEIRFAVSCEVSVTRHSEFFNYLIINT